MAIIDEIKDLPADLTLSGSPASVDSTCGTNTGIDFDEVDDRGEKTGSILLGETDYGCAFYIDAGIQTQQGLIVEQFDAATNQGFFLTITTSGTLNLEVRNGLSNRITYSKPSSGIEGAGLLRIFITFEGSTDTYKMYIDKAEVGSTPGIVGSGFSGWHADTIAKPFSVGARNSDTTFFLGEIHYIVQFNHFASQQDVDDDFDAALICSTGIPPTGNGRESNFSESGFSEPVYD